MTDTKITIPVTFDIPLERVVNCIVGFVENGYSPWAHDFLSNDDPATVAALASSKDEERTIWYARERFWQDKGSAHLRYDRAEDGEGEGKGSMNIGLVDLQRGLATMAEKAPEHFADLVRENDDAVTHDVFMQMVVFQEIIYG